MSFICCDSETHQLVVKLYDRLSSSIINYFENRYSKQERVRVQSVVIGLNAQYQSFIYRLFPNAKIIIDRFHIVQLAGRAFDNSRISLLKTLDKHSREYRILKSQWRLFHQKATTLRPEKPVYLLGINEYMTCQNLKAVINSVKYEFSNGPLEGVNRKIKVLKRSCYGFTNQEFFFLRIDCLFA